MKVLIVSYNNVGNFGDRLGYHLIISVLPPQSEVYFANFKPWNVPPASFDLLILGIGNSIFGPLLNEPLFNLVKSRFIKFKIGIFGTQYREEFDSALMRELIKHLDLWCARYREDLKFYAPNMDHAIHFGDWLIDAFPFARAYINQTLKIGDEIWQNLPLDRVIQEIQLYKRVYSTRLHPLLCALTSAEEVAYREQRESGTGRVSGKFRSMFLDIFGKDYPENKFFAVERDKVSAYKRFVRKRVEGLRGFLGHLFERQTIPNLQEVFPEFDSY